MPQKILNFIISYYKRLQDAITTFRARRARRQRIEIEKKTVLRALKKKGLPGFAQLKHLPRFLDKKEKRNFVIFSFLSVLGTVGLIVVFYLNNTIIAPAKGGEYVEGIVGYPRFINPLYSSNNDTDKDLVELVYSGLVYRTAKGGYAPDLSEKYAISDDEKVYTFYLRKNIFWHDGKLFTADDVIFTIDAIKNKDYNSSLRESWGGIKVEKIDDYTVQFQLEEAFSSFLSLAGVKIMPKHIWEKVPIKSINLAEANNKPIGTGPYIFKSFIKDRVGVIRSYTFERNAKYYGTKPNIDTFVVRFYSDYNSAITALDSRQIDGLAFVPSEARANLKFKSRLESHTLYLPQYNAIFFNTQNNKALQDKAVRQAFALSINRDRIIKEALGGDGEAIGSPVLFGFLTYNEISAKIQYDFNASQKLLVDGGWVFKDGESVRAKGGARLKVELATLEKQENIKAVALIKDDWEKLGVEVDVKIISASDISRDLIENRSYQAFLFGQMLGQDLDLYPYWHSSARKYPGFNLALYSNRNIDVLLEQARRTLDRVEKQKKYEELNSLLIEDFPAIILWMPKYVYFIDKKVQGVQMKELINPSERFRHLFSSYINTRRAFK